jgi:hypothetical protein
MRAKQELTRVVLRPTGESVARVAHRSHPGLLRELMPR